MVHTKLHFYVNSFHVWSRLGGINSIWPKECSMQSEFPWLQLTAAPMPCALDQAIVVHDPLHRRVSCFTVPFSDGRRCICLRFWECFIGYTVQIWLLSIFGQRVAKNYPTPVDVYQLTHVLQQVWQSKLFNPHPLHESVLHKMSFR